jgi:hypothetical protein
VVSELQRISRSAELIMEIDMTTQPQFFLITSVNIPADLWILSEDETAQGDKTFDGRIEEDFGQVLTPLGNDLTKATISVPGDTKFAGVLWGDGEHFDMDRDPVWGILGEIERIGMNHYCVRGANGTVIADSLEMKDGGDEIPHVMPPEVFGLKRQPWWNSVYAWCDD